MPVSSSTHNITSSSPYFTLSIDSVDTGNNDFDQYGECTDLVSSPALSVANLPPEVLVEVFSNLTPNCLDACSLVCKHWYNVLNNDASWRAAFYKLFDCRSFNRVTSSLKWRTELVSRLDIIHKWTKGHAKNLSFNGGIMEISHVFSDFSASRLILFSSQLGVGVVADPSKGKVATPRIFTDKSLQYTGEVCCTDGSRFGMIFGLRNGNLCGVIFSQETRIRDYSAMNGSHTGEVSSVWINKLESPRAYIGIGALSGGEDGHVFAWDLDKGEIIHDYTLCQGVAVTHIKCDSKDRAIAITADGKVFILFEGAEEFALLGQFSVVLNERGRSYSRLSFFEVDFNCNFAVYADDFRILRFKISNDPSHFEIDEFVTPEARAIDCVAIDRTQFSRAGTNKDTPGGNCRYLAASSSNDLIFIWLLQAEATDHRIEPFRKMISPFQVDRADVPSVTAIALNSVVLLVGSYNGVTVAYELLTGKYLRVVSSRFSKRALNLRANPHFADTGLLSISHLEFDSEPSNPHGIIVIGSAIQYFDLGATLSAVKKKGVKKARRNKYFAGVGESTAVASKEEISKEIEQGIELMNIEDAEVAETQEANQRLKELFDADGLSEEDQLQYALMLSQDNEKKHINSNEEDEEELHRAIEQSLLADSPVSDDEDVRKALQESLTSTTKSFKGKKVVVESSDGSDDEEMRRAMSISLAETNSRQGHFYSQEEGSSNACSNSALNATGNDKFDEDLDYAIKLSLMEADN